MSETRTLEGLIIPIGGPADKSGDMFPEGAKIDSKTFMDYGYVFKQVRWRTPGLADVVGQPIAIDQERDGEHLRAKIFDRDLVRAIDSGAQFGFAISGMVLASDGNPDDGRKITSFRLNHVSLVPADQLVDPRCVCTVIDGRCWKP